MIDIGGELMSMQDADEFDSFPQPPQIPQETIEHCVKTGDYKPILFEWYKYVGLLAVTTACIAPESLSFRKVDPRHYHVLMGQLNRCSKLMLANVALSHESRFGETTAIVDRSSSRQLSRSLGSAKTHPMKSLIAILPMD
jgi:hypothetical protein